MIKNVNEIGYEHYFIDTEGNVYSEDMKIRKLFVNKQKKNGYVQVMLQNKKMGLKPKLCYVHRLVAKTFIPNVENHPQVNHIDYCRANNNISNLEWVSLNKQAVHRWERMNRQLFDNLILDTVLIQKGISNFIIYKDINYLNNLWNCSSSISYEVLQLYKIKTNNRYRFSSIIRKEIAEEMKSIGIYNRFPTGWKDKIKSKYYKKYKIIITQHILQKIKSDILKKLL
jgi:hypothetical protein